MDSSWILACCCAALTVVCAAFWCLVDAPKLFAAWRAADAPRKLAFFLRITPCYDGLVQNFKCHHVAADGELRGQIAAEAPLVAENGLLEESAVALLLDSLTGFALWSAGYPGFVTAELTFKVHGTVRKGDELFIKAWLKQKPTVPDKRLREFATLAFELFLPQPDQDTYAEEALVASGEQLMLSIAKPAQRFFWKLQLLCPIYFDWKWKSDMMVLDSFNKYSKPFGEIRSIQELLDLKTKEPGLYESLMSPRLLNVNGVGHGAAIAALLCAAAKLWQKEAKVQKASITYVSPVPGMLPVNMSVKPVVASTNELQVLLRCKDGPVLARGKVVIQLPRRPLPGTGRLGGLIRPILSPIPGGPMSLLPQKRDSEPAGPEDSTSPAGNEESDAEDSDALNSQVSSDASSAKKDFALDDAPNSDILREDDEEEEDLDNDLDQEEDLDEKPEREQVHDDEELECKKPASCQRADLGL